MSTISSAIPTLAVPTPTDKVTSVQAGEIKAADRAINSFLKEPALLEALSKVSSTYVPPGAGRVMSLLWGMMNLNGGSFVYREGVEAAVIELGGGSATVDALWKQLSPEGKDIINAGDFATNPYLLGVLSVNLTTVQEDVNAWRLQAAASSGATSMMDFLHGGADNILSGFSGGTGTALDLFS